MNLRPMMYQLHSWASSISNFSQGKGIRVAGFGPTGGGGKTIGRQGRKNQALNKASNGTILLLNGPNMTKLHFWSYFNVLLTYQIYFGWTEP